MVTSYATLLVALKTAAPGDVIQLAAGSYFQPVLSGFHFAAPGVTLTSADPAHPAVLVGLGVAKCAGLTFKGLELTTVGYVHDPYYAFRLASCDQIAFTGCDVHGDPMLAPGAQITGFYVLDSSNISWTYNRLHDINAAIGANRNHGLTIANNSFSHLNKGGVELGGNSQVSITDNDFTDFHITRGTHADAVQIFTAGTMVIASDTVLTGNLFFRGSGDPIQGLFIQDEVGTLPFHNVTVRDNAVIGGMWDSIYLHANFTGALTVENNIAVSWAGPDWESTPAGATTPLITNFAGAIMLLGDLSHATVSESGNTAQGYSYGPGYVSNVPGNVKLGPVTDFGASALYAWATTRPGRRTP